MATTKATAPPRPPQVHHEDVPRIIVPEGLDFRDAAGYLIRRADEEDAVANFPLEIPGALVWPVAYALQRVLERGYSATPTPAPDYGHPSNAPVEVQVLTGRGPVTVRMGMWTIAGIGNAIAQSYVDDESGNQMVRVVFRGKRKLRRMIETLRDEVLAEVHKRELYAGSALALKVRHEGDDDARSLPIDLRTPPEAVPVLPMKQADVILPEVLTRAVQAELFYPIENAEGLADAGIPTRRGIMLAGRPGTGKTLTARIAAWKAVAQGWTVFYLADARGLPSAIRLAQAHSPALLVAEDIDRTLSGERTSLTDVVLNALDGLDRSARLVLIVTSNAPQDLPAALLRPGRLDSFLTFPAPDALAALRLVELYLGRKLPGATGTVVGLRCSGLLSAGIREVVARATLHARAHGDGFVTDTHLLDAAESVRIQQGILEAAEAPDAEEMPRLELHLRHAPPAIPDLSGTVELPAVLSAPAGNAARMDGLMTRLENEVIQ